MKRRLEDGLQSTQDEVAPRRGVDHKGEVMRKEVLGEAIAFDYQRMRLGVG